MFEKIVINSLKGIEKIIAQKCDKDGDGVLQNDFRYQEVSIFNKANKTYDGESFIVEGTAYHKDGSFNGVRNVPSESGNIFKTPNQNKVSTKKDVKSKQVSVKRTENGINNSMNYSRASILEIALDQAIKRMPEVKNLETAFARINEIKTKYPQAYKRALEKANYVTDMVMKNCKKYEIADLMPVITTMLGVETGGFDFSSRVMVHGNSQFKGVMQTNFDIIKDIYNDTSSSDAKFVQELKSKYKTPDKLYKAIQSDVELGLQVGILAFKLKLRGTNGNVAKGIENYCGNQYKYDYPLKTPRTVTV